MTYEGYNIGEFNARKFDVDEELKAGSPGEAWGTMAFVERAWPRAQAAMESSSQSAIGPQPPATCFRQRTRHQNEGNLPMRQRDNIRSRRQHPDLLSAGRRQSQLDIRQVAERVLNRRAQEKLASKFIIGGFGSDLR